MRRMCACVCRCACVLTGGGGGDGEQRFDAAAFEGFLVAFLQHQFYRCLEAYVSRDRDLFLRLGGRDLQGLALEVKCSGRGARVRAQLTPWRVSANLPSLMLLWARVLSCFGWVIRGS